MRGLADLELGVGQFPLAVHLPKQLREQLLRLLHQEPGELIHRLLHRRLKFLDDVLDRLCDAGDGDQGGDEGEEDRDCARDGLFDEIRRVLRLSLRDGPDGGEDGVGDVHDLVEPFDERDDHVVDREADFHHAANRVRKARDPGYRAHDDGVDDEIADAVDHCLLEVVDHLQQALPDAKETLGQQDLHHLNGFFEEGDLFLALLAELLDQDRAEVGVGEAEDLQGDGDDALEVQFIRQLDPRARHRAEEPAHQARLHVTQNVGAELFEPAYNGGDEVFGETQRVGDDSRYRIAGLFDHPPYLFAVWSGDGEGAANDEFQHLVLDVLGEGDDVIDQRAEDFLGFLQRIPCGHLVNEVVDQPGDPRP